MSYRFFIMTTTTMMLIKVHASISHFTAFPFVNNFCCLFFYFSRTLFHWLKIAALLSQVMTQKRLFWLKWNVWLRIWSKNCLWTATWYKKSHRYVTILGKKISIVRQFYIIIFFFFQTLKSSTSDLEERLQEKRCSRWVLFLLSK